MNEEITLLIYILLFLKICKQQVLHMDVRLTCTTLDYLPKGVFHYD